MYVTTNVCKGSGVILDKSPRGRYVSSFFRRRRQRALAKKEAPSPPPKNYQAAPPSKYYHPSQRNVTGLLVVSCDLSSSSSETSSINRRKPHTPKFSGIHITSAIPATQSGFYVHTILFIRSAHFTSLFLSLYPRYTLQLRLYSSHGISNPSITSKIFE